MSNTILSSKLNTTLEFDFGVSDKGETLQKTCAETAWITLAQCQNEPDKQFAKRIYCGKEWCPVCGQKRSAAHNRRIARTLASHSKDKDGNVQVRLEEVSKTRVKVDRINSLSNDLALALAAPSIRIEAPVPGKSVVGIEVPNSYSSLVSLRGVIETNVFQKMQARAKLAMALGKGAGGEAVAADLAKMPHLLIAGATGSGKTVCLNAIICCLILNIYKYILC